MHSKGRNNVQEVGILKENPHDNPQNRQETGAKEVKATLKGTATENTQLPPAQILRMELT